MSQVNIRRQPRSSRAQGSSPTVFEEKKDCLRGQHPFAFFVMLEQGKYFRDESFQPDLDKVSIASRIEHVKTIALAYRLAQDQGDGPR
jgi:hypothetical protein